MCAYKKMQINQLECSGESLDNFLFHPPHEVVVLTLKELTGHVTGFSLPGKHIPIRHLAGTKPKPQPTVDSYTSASPTLLLGGLFG